MKRKIIKQANQAYTLTLPIDWVRQNNLDKKESEVEVNLADKNLIITNPREVSLKKAKIEVNNYGERMISRVVNAFYAKGVDELELVSKKDISSILNKQFHENLGYALVSQEGDSYIIKDVGGSNYGELDEIFKRVFQMILLFYDSAIRDVFGVEKETLESNNSRDEEINKFCLYLERAISKMSYPDPINGRVLFAYSFALEKIGDEIHRLWRTNIKYKVKKTPALKELLELSNKGLSMAFESYYGHKPEMAEEIMKIRDRVREKSMNLLKLDATTARFVRHCVKIVEDAGDLSHLTLIRTLGG